MPKSLGAVWEKLEVDRPKPWVTFEDERPKLWEKPEDNFPNPGPAFLRLSFKHNGGAL